MELSINNNSTNFGMCMSPQRKALMRGYRLAKRNGTLMEFVKSAQTPEQCNLVARRLRFSPLRLSSLCNDIYNLAKQRAQSMILDSQNPEFAQKFNEAKSIDDIAVLVRNSVTADECKYIAAKTKNNMGNSIYFEKFDENVIQPALEKSRIISCIDECANPQSRAIVNSVLGESLTKPNFPEKFNENAFKDWANKMGLPEPKIENGIAVFNDNEGNMVRRITENNIEPGSVYDDRILLYKDGKLMGGFCKYYYEQHTEFLNELNKDKIPQRISYLVNGKWGLVR